MLFDLSAKTLKVIEKLYHNYHCSNKLKAYLPPLGHFVSVICDRLPSFKNFSISFLINIWFHFFFNIPHGHSDFRGKDERVVFYDS